MVMKTKVICYQKPGDASVLGLSEVQLPPCKDNEVLIRVKSSGINKPDIFQRKGRYPAPPGFSMPNVPGLEVAGIIEHCGSGVTRWKAGDEVCALLAGGGYAEYVIVEARHCLPKPAGLSFSEAASLPETTFTVWHNLFQRGGLKKGESVLIHGGSGGIGVKDGHNIGLGALRPGTPRDLGRLVQAAVHAHRPAELCGRERLPLVE